MSAPDFDNQPPASEPAVSEADPFEQRPVLIFRASPSVLASWGILVSLGVMLSLAFVAGVVVALARHLNGPAVVCAFLALLAAAVIAHALRNPPSSIALNVETRRYHLRKGSGRFRKNVIGDFGDLCGVASLTDESSHGVSGYRVAILIGARKFPCVVEAYGPAGGQASRERARRLAGILGIEDLTESASGRRPGKTSAC